MTKRRQKIAILGGGIGALTAAYALSEIDPQGERFEITLYQLGWRLGGKCASGRNREHGERIEEHGLHVWAGFYENAFSVLRSAIRAARPDGQGPQGTIAKAFERQNLIFLTERYAGRWQPWPCYFAPDPDPDLFPGRDDILAAPDTVLPGLVTLIERALATLVFNFRWYREHWPTDPQAEGAARLARAPAHVHARLVTPTSAAPASSSDDGPGHPLLDALAQMARLVLDSDGRDPGHVDALLAVLQLVQDMIALHLGNSGLATEVRRYLVMFGLGVRVVGGAVLTGCLERGLSAIDGLEFRQFLCTTGPADESVDNALVRSLYDYAFAYEDGLTPNLSACTAVQGLARMFLTYKGGFFYKATAGMGDTFCTPIYQVLKQRGVRFEFFRDVLELAPTPDGFDIGTITIGRQATLAEGITEYQPLHTVNDLPSWPSAPHWQQLKDGATYAHEGVDFEDVLDRRPPVAIDVLRKGEQFDQVVLGLSVASLASVCAPLIAANPAWADMVAGLKTTRTQALQLWLDVEPAANGGPYVAPVDPPQTLGPIATAFLKPFDTWSDMSHLAPAEAWPAPPPKQVAYFCAVMPDAAAPDDQHAADKVVHANAMGWMTDALATLWPNIGTGSNFRWDWLHAPADLQGPARLDAQFWQANVNPSERYVLSLPGTLQHRMESGASGYDNLVLAGDWTKVPDINAGCVEVAAMSGLMAAAAVSGVDIPIVASDTLYRRPQIANVGGWLTMPPPPSQCQGARVRGWGLPTRAGALQRFLDGGINRAAGWRRFRPLADMAFLMQVDCATLRSGAPPWNREGTLSESDIGFWLPVGVHDDDGALPGRIGWLPACLFVDQPIASTSGRELWGFPKFAADLSPPDPDRTSGGPFTVHGKVVRRFAPEARAERVELLRIQGRDIHPIGGDGPLWNGFLKVAHFLDDAVSGVLQFLHGDHGLIPGVDGLPVPVFYLKQFRAADSPTDACYQQVLAGNFGIDRLGGAGLLPGHWTLRFAVTDSLPFVRDLGLGTPEGGVLEVTSPIGFWADADFTVGLASPLPPRR